MNAKISVFVICVETIIYLLVYKLHDCTFKLGHRITYGSCQAVSTTKQYNIELIELFDFELVSSHITCHRYVYIHSFFFYLINS